eukprot:403371072
MRSKRTSQNQNQYKFRNSNSNQNQFNRNNYSQSRTRQTEHQNPQAARISNTNLGQVNNFQSNNLRGKAQQLQQIQTQGFNHNNSKHNNEIRSPASPYNSTANQSTNPTTSPQNSQFQNRQQYSSPMIQNLASQNSKINPNQSLINNQKAMFYLFLQYFMKLKDQNSRGNLKTAIYFCLGKSHAERKEISVFSNLPELNYHKETHEACWKEEFLEIDYSLSKLKNLRLQDVFKKLNGCGFYDDKLDMFFPIKWPFDDIIISMNNIEVMNGILAKLSELSQEEMGDYRQQKINVWNLVENQIQEYQSQKIQAVKSSSSPISHQIPKQREISKLITSHEDLINQLNTQNKNSCNQSPLLLPQGDQDYTNRNVFSQDYIQNPSQQKMRIKKQRITAELNRTPTCVDLLSESDRDSAIQAKQLKSQNALQKKQLPEQDKVQINQPDVQLREKRYMKQKTQSQNTKNKRQSDCVPIIKAKQFQSQNNLIQDEIETPKKRMTRSSKLLKLSQVNKSDESQQLQDNLAEELISNTATNSIQILSQMPTLIQKKKESIPGSRQTQRVTINDQPLLFEGKTSSEKEKKSQKGRKRQNESQLKDQNKIQELNDKIKKRPKRCIEDSPQESKDQSGDKLQEDMEIEKPITFDDIEKDLKTKNKRSVKKERKQESQSKKQAKNFSQENNLDQEDQNQRNQMVTEDLVTPSVSKVTSCRKSKKLIEEEEKVNYILDAKSPLFLSSEILENKKLKPNSTIKCQTNFITAQSQNVDPTNSNDIRINETDSSSPTDQKNNSQLLISNSLNLLQTQNEVPVIEIRSPDYCDPTSQVQHANILSPVAEIEIDPREPQIMDCRSPVYDLFQSTGSPLNQLLNECQEKLMNNEFNHKCVGITLFQGNSN